jgi:hypothetical protein
VPKQVFTFSTNRRTCGFYCPAESNATKQAVFSEENGPQMADRQLTRQASLHPLSEGQ